MRTTAAIAADPALRVAAAHDLAHSAGGPILAAVPGLVLPPFAAGLLSGPLAQPLENLAEGPIEAALASGTFRVVWAASNRVLHDEALAVAERHSLLGSAIGLLGGRAVLDRAHTTVRLIDVLGRALPLASLLLLVLGVAVAPRRRLHAFATAALAAGTLLVLADVALLVVRPLLAARLAGPVLPSTAASELVRIVLAPARADLLRAAFAALALGAAAVAAAGATSPRSRRRLESLSRVGSEPEELRQAA